MLKLSVADHQSEAICNDDVAIADYVMTDYNQSPTTGGTEIKQESLSDTSTNNVKSEFGNCALKSALSNTAYSELINTSKTHSEHLDSKVASINLSNYALQKIGRPRH